MNYKMYETTIENCLKAKFITIMEYRLQLRNIEQKDNRALEQFMDELTTRIAEIRAQQRQEAMKRLTNINGLSLN